MDISKKLRENYYVSRLPWPAGTDPDWISGRQKHALEQMHLDEEFKRDALSALGLNDHPRRDAIFRRAWEFKHEKGHSAVFAELQLLTDFLESQHP